MNPQLVLVFVAIVLPFAVANYGQGAGSGGGGGGGHGGNNDGGYGGGTSGFDDLLNAASQRQHHHGGASITAGADVGAGPSAQPGLAHANAQLQNLNANPTYQRLQNSDAIAESLAENNLAANMRQGNINVVAPNVVGQSAFRALLVPNGPNNHIVTATQPLQPIVVNQPGAPPAHVSSGPPAIVRASPIIYKLKPSIIYQQEVINKVPNPISLNPVYVKVYKPGKVVDAPVGYHGHGSSDGGSAGGNDGGFGNGGSQFAGGAQASYGNQPGY